MKRIEELERNLDTARTVAPTGTAELAQGQEPIQLTFKATVRSGTITIKEYRINTTWDEVFSVISPLMIDKASEQQLSFAIREHFYRRIVDQEPAGSTFVNVALLNTDFQKLKVQYRALGLITKETSQKSLKDTSTYWTLTPYGDTFMTKLNAQKAAPPAAEAVS